jgi:hypothetical protein
MGNTSAKKTLTDNPLLKQNPVFRFVRDNMGILVGLLVMCLILVVYDAFRRF